jgi:protein-S-isoprenylcysteine O-methyltransferase Ste14
LEVVDERVSPSSAACCGVGLLVGTSAVLRDQALVTGGPFRRVRHPPLVRHVGILVGAGLGSLNWLLLAVWPLLLAGVFMSSRHEEELLREKFACESPAD